MNIEVTSKMMDITPSIRERVESRFEKLERLQVPLINPRVVVEKEGKEFIVEATVSIPNEALFAHATHEDVYAAINEVGQKLERQLKSHNEKPLAHRAQRSGKEQLRVDAEAVSAEE